MKKCIAFWGTFLLVFQAFSQSSFNNTKEAINAININLKDIMSKKIRWFNEGIFDDRNYNLEVNETELIFTETEGKSNYKKVWTTKIPYNKIDMSDIADTVGFTSRYIGNPTKSNFTLLKIKTISSFTTAYTEFSETKEYQCRYIRIFIDDKVAKNTDNLMAAFDYLSKNNPQKLPRSLSEKLMAAKGMAYHGYDTIPDFKLINKDGETKKIDAFLKEIKSKDKPIFLVVCDWLPDSKAYDKLDSLTSTGVTDNYHVLIIKNCPEEKPLGDCEYGISTKADLFISRNREYQDIIYNDNLAFFWIDKSQKVVYASKGLGISVDRILNLLSSIDRNNALGNSIQYYDKEMNPISTEQDAKSKYITTRKGNTAVIQFYFRKLKDFELYDQFTYNIKDNGQLIPDMKTL